MQPALKYLAPQPFFNRYRCANSQEVITYPTAVGDLTLNRRHTEYVQLLKESPKKPQATTVVDPRTV